MRYNKKFSQDLSDRYDAKGKRIAESIMADLFQGILIKENHSEKNGDFSDGFWDQMYRLNNGKCICVEPEVKDSKWYGEQFVELTGYPFQFCTMDIPYRKVKCKADLHMVISSDEKYSFVVTRKVMDEWVEENNGPKKKVTKYEPQGGYYYSIPLERGLFLVYEKKKWRVWKKGKK